MDKVFVVDVDDCVANFMLQVFKKLGHPKRWAGYRLKDWYPDYSDSYLERIIYAHDTYRACMPVPGAATSLQRLHKQGLNIRYYTARRSTLLELTQNWLRAGGFPNSDNVSCFNRHEDKMEKITKEKPFAVIDDRAETMATLKNFCEIPILYDRPWNHTWRSLDPIRVLDWTHVEHLLNGR